MAPGDTATPTEVPLILGEPPASPGANLPTEISATEISATEIPATEIPPTETEVQALAIVRVQRTDGSSPAQVLVDGDPTTVWMTDGSAALPLAAFVADLDSVHYVSTIAWLSGTDGIAGTLHISVSTDEANWTDLSIDTTVAPGQWQQLAVAADVRYVRFVFVNDDGLDVIGGIAEIEILP